jgi:hypothetical protein
MADAAIQEDGLERNQMDFLWRYRFAIYGLLILACVLWLALR